MARGENGRTGTGLRLIADIGLMLLLTQETDSEILCYSLTFTLSRKI
jgi:hypothetical protein